MAHPTVRHFSQRVAKAILDDVAHHGDLGRACRDNVGAEARNTWWRWNAKGKTLDGVSLRDALTAARTMYVESLQDQIPEAMNELRDAVQGTASDSARVSAIGKRIGVMQWWLEKWMPHVYGQHVQVGGQVEHGVTVRLVQYSEMPGITVDATPSNGDDARAPDQPARLPVDTPDE